VTIGSTPSMASDIRNPDEQPESGKRRPLKWVYVTWTESTGVVKKRSPAVMQKFRNKTRAPKVRKTSLAPALIVNQAFNELGIWTLI